MRQEESGKDSTRDLKFTSELEELERKIRDKTITDLEVEFYLRVLSEWDINLEDE